jgi:hypothetical protein
MRRRAKRRLMKALEVIVKVTSFGLIKLGKTDKVKAAGEALNEAASFGDSGFRDEDTK